MIVKFIKEHALFFLILFCCAVLRLVPLFDYQFTLDELSGLNRTRFDNLGDLVQKGIKIDAHPAFVQLLIFVLVKLHGYVNWIVKLPFLLMSLGGVCYAYFFCIRNFTKQAGIIATLVFSFSLIFVFYAPIARMYSAGVFFSIALLYYFFEIFFSRATTAKNYVCLGVFALLSALNHHINALFALTVCLSGLVFLNSGNIRAYLLTCVITVLFYLPHLQVTLYQLSIGGIGFEQNGWLPVPEANAVFKFLQILAGTGKSYVIFLLLIVLSIVIQRRVLFSKKQLFLLSLFAVNYLVIYFYSVFRAPVYQYSVMLFAAVAAVLFFSSMFDYKNTYFFYGAATLVAAVLLYKTYFKKDYLHQSVKTVFEYQFERTAHYKNLYGDKNVYPVFFDADEFMQQIYFQKYQRFDCKISSDALTTSTKLFAEFVAGLNSDYLVLSSAFPAQQAIAAQYFPFLIENTQTQGINFKLYSKRAADKNRQVAGDALIMLSNVNNPANFVYSRAADIKKESNGFLLSVDSLNEFPFDAKSNYSDVVTGEGQVLLVKTRFRFFSAKSGALATCISVTDRDTNTNYMYSAKDVSEFVGDADSSVTVYVDNFFGTAHRRIKDHSNLGLYVWNKGGDKFELWDFEIRLVDFWPRKWQLWD